jgi:phosphatidylinositol alpha 1,6-mannosyltransferase
MVCGLPVVLADTVGSHVDLVKPGKTGFVFEKENAESLAKCLVELNSDRERCQSMGEQARRLIADWSYDCIVESLLSALRATAPKLGAWENNSKRSRNGSG